MSILIKGMKAPASCSKCRMSGWSNYYQLYKCDVCDQAVAKYASEYQMAKPEWCPLIEIPEPHGRLIDASYKVDMPFYDDEYEEYSVRTVTAEELLMMADNEVPTVIEAEGSEDNA